MPRLVRSDTNRVLVDVLWPLFTGPELVAEERADSPGNLLFRWPAARGDGEGMLLVPKDDAEALEAVRRSRADPAMQTCARALVAVALDVHEVEGGWHLERVLELLHGKRSGRQSRHRQLERVHLLMALFERCSFRLTAHVAASAPKKTRSSSRSDEDAGERGRYGGELGGPLLQVDRRNRRTATVNAKQLHDLVRPERSPSYQMVPESAFRLSMPGRRNPHGRKPSRAHLSRIRLGWFDHVRRRKGQRTQGKLQAVTYADFLELAGLPGERIRARGLHESFLDDIEHDLRSIGADVGVTLEAVERVGPADRWMLRPVLVDPPEPAPRPAPARPGSQNPIGRRLMAGTTATGSATSTGPP